MMVSASGPNKNIRARPSYQPVVLSHIRTVVGENKKDLNIVEYVLGVLLYIFTYC